MNQAFVIRQFDHYVSEASGDSLHLNRRLSKARVFDTMLEAKEYAKRWYMPGMTVVRIIVAQPVLQTFKWPLVGWPVAGYRPSLFGEVRASTGGIHDTD